MRLRSLWDVSIPAPDQVPEGAVLLYDRGAGRWVAQVLHTGLPPHQHSPGDITPQGEGSGLDADTVDGVHASGLASANHTHPEATTSTPGFLSALDKSKLDSLSPQGQLAFGKVRVGTTDVVASVIQDILELVAGNNISLTPDAATKKVTASVSPQGPGSNLNADLLDGYHASSFALLSHSHALSVVHAANTASVTINQTTSSPVTITSVSITPGSWIVLGSIQLLPASTTSATFYGYLRRDTTSLRTYSVSANSNHGLVTMVLITLVSPTTNQTITLSGATSNTSYTATVAAYGGNLLAIRYAN